MAERNVLSTETPGILVAEEDIGSILPELVMLFARTRASNSTIERFDWLYRKNPDGPSVVWSVREGHAGGLVGFTACLPRRMVIDGAPCMAWNSADFSIDPRFRTLGPAMKLRRQARMGVESGRAAFLYAHPNNRMATIHRQVGNLPVGSMLRLARPLRLGDYLGDRLQNRRFGHLLGAVVDPLYRLSFRQTWTRPRRAYSFVPHVRFDQRFDELFARHTGTCRALGVRDASYLNWRYAENPIYQTHGLLCERDGRLEGYLLFAESRGLCEIKDLFPPHDPDLGFALIDATVRTGWRLGLRGISMILLEQSPLLEPLLRCGFKRRTEQSQMFAFAHPESTYARLVNSPQSWHITSGDRDI